LAKTKQFTPLFPAKQYDAFAAKCRRQRVYRGRTIVHLTWLYTSGRLRVFEDEIRRAAGVDLTRGGSGWKKEEPK